MSKKDFMMNQQGSEVREAKCNNCGSKYFTPIVKVGIISTNIITPQKQMVSSQVAYTCLNCDRTIVYDKKDEIEMKEFAKKIEQKQKGENTNDMETKAAKIN